MIVSPDRREGRTRAQAAQAAEATAPEGPPKDAPFPPPAPGRCWRRRLAFRQESVAGGLFLGCGAMALARDLARLLTATVNV